MSSILRSLALLAIVSVAWAFVPAGGMQIRMGVSLADRATSTIPSSNEVAQAPLQRVRTEAELCQALTAAPNELVIVKFGAPYCRACMALQRSYAKIAIEHPNVKFLEVDVAESLELKRALGIRVVPTIHAYAGPLGRVFAETVGPSKVDRLRSVIASYEDVSSVVRKSRSGIMEKLGSFTGSLPARIHVPGLQQQQLRVGLMEKLARSEALARAAANAASLGDLAVLAA